VLGGRVRKAVETDLDQAADADRHAEATRAANWVHSLELKSTLSYCSHEPFWIQPTSGPPPGWDRAHLVVGAVLEAASLAGGAVVGPVTSGAGSEAARSIRPSPGRQVAVGFAEDDGS
jgi:hypothetical protein